MATQAKTAQRAEPLVQTLVLAVLFATPALLCVRAAAIGDPDIWWHLRTGEWIVAHHAVPYLDTFSSSTAGHSWAAYSWLFELLVFGLFQTLGLSGILVYAATLVLAITVAMHRLVRGAQQDFSLAVLLTFVACFSLGSLFTPRPWLFTILFFVVELDLLLRARRTGKLRSLLWLPVIFVLWANIHIQFIDGLIVLGFAVVDAYAGRARRPAKHPQPGEVTSVYPFALATLLAACTAATCVNPYGWRIFAVAYELAAQKGVMDKISELQAIPFRTLADFLVLALALGSAAMLARRPRLRFFEVALFVFAAYVSFRSQRDVWVMAAAAAALLAEGLPGSAKAVDRTPRFGVPLAAAAALLAVALGFRVMQVNETTLAAKLAETMPVRAVAAVRQRGYAGALLNDFSWGGYLMWTLREPVSLDGRAALHGDAQINRSLEIFNGQPSWNTGPELAHAGLVVVPAKAPLAQLLREDPRFELAYADSVAVVFASHGSRSNLVAAR